jgi:hypothetical protein
MGVKTMTEQSEDKAKKTSTIDKSTTVQGEKSKSKPVQAELNEQQLEEATGGCRKAACAVG